MPGSGHSRLLTTGRLMGVTVIPGLAVKQASEQAAVNAALSDCVKRESECHVIAIGPFTVGPN